MLCKDQIIEDLDEVENEINILRQIRHQNIIQLFEIIESQKNLYMILEYANGGTLQQKLNHFQKISEAQSLYYLRQIIEGLHYLHSQKILHADIRLDNLLLNDDVVKISNFGSLKLKPHQIYYSTPQRLSGLPYDQFKEDIWNLGVVFYTMLTGKLPFYHQKIDRLVMLIQNMQYLKPNYISSKTYNVLKLLFQQVDIVTIRDAIAIEEIQVNPLVEEQLIISELIKLGFDVNKLYEMLGQNKHNTLTTCYYLIRNKLQKQIQVQQKQLIPINERKKLLIEKLQNTLQFKSYKCIRIQTEVSQPETTTTNTNKNDQRMKTRIHSVSKNNQSYCLTSQQVNNKLVRIFKKSNYVIMIKQDPKQRTKSMVK